MKFFAVLSFVALVSAAPVSQLSIRDVFVPPVLTPNSKTVWKVGAIETVTWDVSEAPKSITNSEARVVLVTDGHMDLDNPLAEGVSVLDGQVKVKVPQVAAGKNYQILVFGDSGNKGEFFTIEL
ncbi:hypothetical protein D9619_007419 [Psilocybe cf. subviscida]|uniref:Yeast cell wall synthesis Kre9/Knh1-like N-terminal domain-containing protein n=1 Tax=Psilocybe cf. subviscida TaxID=2480587 RepID=A0A8H5EWM1_9AGAR|nr:hypothetical protein D9619_007419 [Psilocybe cf. subviscida]